MRITNSIKKSVLSVLLVAVFLLTGVSPLAANSFGNFTVELQVDAGSRNLSSSDLSNVKIDIYESILDRYEPSADAYIYGHVYSHSVYTNSKGSVTFAKPSALFLVLIDLTTLPSDAGIDKTTVFYHNALQKSDSFAVSDIADFEINCDTSAPDGVRVDITNAYGKTIHADYTVTPSIVANAKSSVLASTYQITGFVTVGSIAKYYDFNVENNGDKLELIANALETGSISKEEALDLYLELYEMRDFDDFCLTPLTIQLASLYRDAEFFAKLPNTKQDALTSVFDSPKTRNQITYQGPNGNGYFVIYYPDPGTGIVPASIISIYNAFEATKNHFTNTLGLNVPYTTNSTYRVEVVYGSYIRGGETNVLPNNSYDGTSSIEIWTRNGIGDPLEDYLKEVITHEYMHAIMNTYRHLETTPMWFYESFANWATIEQYGASGSDYVRPYVNLFLNATGTSLESLPGNATRAPLLPLYNYTYVKGIIQRLDTHPNDDVYAIIDHVTKNNGSNIYGGWDKMFPRFWAQTYFPKMTYSSYYISSWAAKPATTASILKSQFSNGVPIALGSYSVQPLANNFIDFEICKKTNPGPSSYPITVSATVNPSGSSTNLRSYYVLRCEGSGSSALMAIDITSSIGTLYSVVTYTSWSEDITGCISLTNIGKSGNIGYSVTISQSW